MSKITNKTLQRQQAHSQTVVADRTNNNQERKIYSEFPYEFIIEGDLMANKILVVDDESDIINVIKKYFAINGYDVLIATCGKEALDKISNDLDIIILDINMPDIDGITVCKNIRNFVSCPILFLTANIEDSDKIKGFGAGGDDYIVKPFSIDELGARVSAHLRRDKRQKTSAKVYFDKDFAIDYSERIVYVKNEPLTLRKKEFDVIEVLSLNVGQVFDKEHLYEAAWGLEGIGSNSVVAEHIRRIRAKLLAVGSKQYIQTVWGVGYKWIK